MTDVQMFYKWTLKTINLSCPYQKIIYFWHSTKDLKTEHEIRDNFSSIYIVWRTTIALEHQIIVTSCIFTHGFVIFFMFFFCCCYDKKKFKWKLFIIENIENIFWLVKERKINTQKYDSVDKWLNFLSFFFKFS